MTRDKAFSQLGSVRDEFEAARFAVSVVQRKLQSGEPIENTELVKPARTLVCLKLGVDLFAQTVRGVRSVLRDYWAAARPRAVPRRTSMEALLNRVAALCLIPRDALQEAHEVREQRNAIAHGEGIEQELTFHDCKSRLGKFLSFLPVRW
jgi:hypothetical protein